MLHIQLSGTFWAPGRAWLALGLLPPHMHWEQPRRPATYCMTSGGSSHPSDPVSSSEKKRQSPLRGHFHD